MIHLLSLHCIIFYITLLNLDVVFFSINNLYGDSDVSAYSREKVKPLTCWSRLQGLYCSPQVKFYGNIISYFAFLFLFAVVLMIDFQRTPSAGEQLLYIWLFSLVCEELRQVRCYKYNENSLINIIWLSHVMVT